MYAFAGDEEAVDQGSQRPSSPAPSYYMGSGIEARGPMTLVDTSQRKWVWGVVELTQKLGWKSSAKSL